MVSWLSVNTDYTLRYAHLYYTPPEGGVEFQGSDEPSYADFAYLAFTVGMTYQVADTGLLAPRFRRELLKHSLVSYVFGAVIVEDDQHRRRSRVGLSAGVQRPG